MSILVAVMILTGAAIAIVGLRQRAQMDERFAHLVSIDSQAIVTAQLARIDLLQSVRAEKNAVLSIDKNRAREFADRARQELKEMAQDRAALTRLVDAGPGTPAGKALVDFDRATEEYAAHQKEVLSLAVGKTFIEGRNLLYGELFE